MENAKERGSALVLVMFLALLLTILGVAVLGATMGGAQRTTTRANDVQSLHLAQKGLDEAAAYIQTELDDRTDIDPDNMAQTIQQIIDEVKGKVIGVNNSVSTDLIGARGTITNITYEKQDKQKYYINIEAEATVNGVQRQLRQTITIDTYPDFLKYAFGSEQVLTLNGAPSFHGNIYAGDKLVISDEAKYKYKGSVQPDKRTQYTRVEPLSQAGTEGETAVPSEVHVQSLQSIEYSGAAGSGTVSSNNAATILHTILGVTEEQVFIKPHKKFIQINVEESFLDKVTEALGKDKGSRREVKDAYDAKQLGDYLKARMTKLPSSDPPTKPVLPASPTDDEQDVYNINYRKYVEDLNNYKISQNLLLKNRITSAIYDGDLMIDGVDNQQLTFDLNSKTGDNLNKPKWIIVNGNLEINNYSTDPNHYLSVQANIIVTGKVTIRGRVTFNSTMFVLGETVVEDAVIKGLDNNDKELVLISKGEVLINRIDAFTNQTSEMKAFFYTDSDAYLYGVGSIFWLNGGFFAKGNLTVNSVLGEVDEPSDPTYGFLFDNQEKDRTDLVQRFQVEYNHEVFTHQQSTLPRVQQVNVTVGPLELVNR